MGNTLMPIALVTGAGVGWFGLLWIWSAYGEVGLLTAFMLAGLTGLTWWGSKRARKNNEARLLAENAQAWDAELAQFPTRTHTALWLLADPWQAHLLWTNPKVGIGRPMNPHTGDPGDWPRLLPGQDSGHAPDLGFRPSPVGARVRLMLPMGFSADDVRARLANIAASLDVPKVQVVASDGNMVALELRVRNPLADTVTLLAPEEPVDLRALRVGLREDGDPHRMAVQGTHLMIAGLTGSGKSGVLWSIIAALSPAIRDRLVELHVVDLKMGTEMAAGYRLYASWAYRVLDAITVLERMVTAMTNRADPAREHSMRTGEPLRKHVPTPGDPHHVLIIDEVIALLKLPGKEKAKFLVEQLDGTVAEMELRVTEYAALLLLRLLSQARSFGITVILATQNAAKEIFELLRDMIPDLIGLRLASPEQERMVFGPGAGERGIAATEITVDEAGTVFADSPEAGGSAIRARFFYVNDTDIMHLVRIFGRPADQDPPYVIDADTAAEPEADVVDLEKRRQEADQDSEQADESVCEYCGEPVEQTPGKRRRRYCSDAHRVAAYREKKAQGS